MFLFELQSLRVYHRYVPPSLFYWLSATRAVGTVISSHIQDCVQTTWSDFFTLTHADIFVLTTADLAPLGIMGNIWQKEIL